MQPTDLDPNAPAADDAVRDTSEALLIALMRTLRLVKRVEDQSVEPSQMWLLHTLQCAGSVRLSELAGRLHLDASTVSRQVRALEEAGLVTRTTDPDDRRATQLAATASGHRVLQESFERRRARLAEVLQGWACDDVVAFERMLTRLANTLEEHETESC
ncbi:MarR family winged helix-turn-helix transcriptional regulator [Flindersiella endophytica]